MNVKAHSDIKITGSYKRKLMHDPRGEIIWRLMRVPRIALIAFQKRVSANGTNISGGRYELYAL